MIGNYKGLFHSALVKNGPTVVTIKSDVMPSKYPNKPDYVIIEHQGGEQMLSIENPMCADALRGLKGQTVTLTATGGREDAQIHVSEAGAEAPAASPGRPPQRQSAPARSPQPASPQDALTAFQDAVRRNLNAQYMVLNATTKMGEQAEVDGITITAELLQSMVMNSMIEASRMGLISNLPTEPVWSATSKGISPEEF